MENMELNEVKVEEAVENVKEVANELTEVSKHSTTKVVAVTAGAVLVVGLAYKFAVKPLAKKAKRAIVKKVATLKAKKNAKTNPDNMDLDDIPDIG